MNTDVQDRTTTDRPAPRSTRRVPLRRQLSPTENLYVNRLITDGNAGTTLIVAAFNSSI
ncbi:hypothetical protein [Dactylosporangium sp. CA-092794]|uniref:hypothetical protein n=1 Tax=Dactylosporangium sp. CA-092794 TaxID=3239929 RepID=UPI003D8BFFF7